jgi:hypothetical protein
VVSPKSKAASEYFPKLRNAIFSRSIIAAPPFLP